MQSSQDNVFARPDTFFGICEALGQDLRIPANLLRIAVAGLLFWNPLAGLSAYAAAGVLVAFTRWLYPNPRIAETEAGGAEIAPIAPARLERADVEPVALAA